MESAARVPRKDEKIYIARQYWIHIDVAFVYVYTIVYGWDVGNSDGFGHTRIFSDIYFFLSDNKKRKIIKTTI